MSGKLRFLMADDDIISRVVMQKALAPHGSCDTASNGREAVEAFRLSLKGNKPYDVVLLDIMMPEMDGNDALVAIRELESSVGGSFNSRAKIVMVTSKDEFKSVLNSFNHGCDSYLMKPVTKERVDQLLADLFSTAKNPQKGTPSE
ncbi:hypothetical protein MNBD_NITROSPINAE01-34 [hydrothermal vent metagenome]|uniref:Response regulatory domain-containing protein n=1 Tax=hydrothermal vent metagenome TaxID=652676 RepID=A0A3B1CJS0_9ZZZZ